MRKKLISVMLLAGALSLSIPGGATTAFNPPTSPTMGNIGDHSLKGGAQAAVSTLKTSIGSSSGVTDAANAIDDDNTTVAMFANDGTTNPYAIINFDEGSA